MADQRAGVIEDLTARQLDEFEMRRERRKVLGLENGQEPVGAMTGVQTLRHGTGSAYSTTTRMRRDRPSVAGSI